MANVTGRNGIGERNRSLNVKFEKFVPLSGWTEDSDCHYLLVDLPDFRKEEVKLEVENLSYIRVSGERVISENKFSHFQETYKLPENSSSDNISGKFDGEILHVIVPKKKEPATNEIKEEEEGHEHEKPNNINDMDSSKDKYELESSGHGSHVVKEEKVSETSKSGEREGFEQEIMSREVRGQEKQDSLLESLMEKLNKNKGIVMIVVLAFSLGMLVSYKSESTVP